MPLPTFIIAGERRCGTTSLYSWMTAHPEIALYPRTDENYFVDRELDTRTWRDGKVDATAWDRDHDRDRYAAMFSFAGDRPAIGHKGADLLYWRPAHARIARLVPEVKLIITLRNPVPRAWSQYWNEVGKGRETLGFEAAIAAEDERRRTSDYADFHLAYITRGNYAASFEHLFAHVDRARVHVVTVEETRKQPREVMQGIYRFLGVDPDRGLDNAGAKVNENWTTVLKPWANRPGVREIERFYARAVDAAVTRITKDPERRRQLRKRLSQPFRRPASGIEIPAGVRATLTALYAPHVRELETLLGRELPEWRSR